MNTLVCSRIDYCSSLLTGLPKSRLSAIQSVLNAAVRLIARLPKFTHISTYMTEVLHWLPIATRIRFKALLVSTNLNLTLPPSYFVDFTRKPMSSTSARPLRSADRLDLLVPRIRTALAQCRAFAVTLPFTWNGLLYLLRNYELNLSLVGISATSCRSLKTFLSPGASALKALLTSQYC